MFFVDGSPPRSDIPTISEVIGEGDGAHRIVRVGEWTFAAWASAGEREPRMADVEFCERLSYPSGIYKLRQRIRELREEDPKKFNPFEVSTPRVETGGRPGVAFWLTRREALFLATQMKTPRARAMTHEMVEVYLLARDGLLHTQKRQIPANDEGRQERLVARVTEAVLAAIAPALNLIVPYAQHPDRFLARQELRDSPGELRKVKARMLAVARHHGVSFSRIHGILREEFQIPGYTRLHFTLFDKFMARATDLLDAPLPPPRRGRKKTAAERAQAAERTRQMYLFAGIPGNDRKPN